jgi:hypothetical protein
MLDAEEFLSRILPDDQGFIVFAYKGTEFRGMAHNFFPRQDLTDAVGWLRWGGVRFDLWHAVALYKDAELKNYKNGRPVYRGKRTQANALSLKCFWYDADIARPGDGKDPAQVWKNDVELTLWLNQLKKVLPLPNLWIRSGYGMHFYWVLDNPIARDQWLPYAQAFQKRLIRAGARGDIGITTDCARILRPPETRNHKVPASPMQVFDDTPAKLGLPDYYGQSFLDLLNSVSTGTKLGPAPGGLHNSPLVAAAKSNLPRAPRDFRLIGTKCLQVEKSLAEAGKHDGRQLWHLMVNLAYICGDRQLAHEVGNKHPTYTPTDTDAKWDQTDHEHQGKDFGAPRCTALDAARPGICDHCTYKNQINSPYALGLQAGVSVGLPANYRRNNGRIELFAKDEWTKLIDGEFDNVKLMQYGEDNYRILFDYTLANHTSHVAVNSKNVVPYIDKLKNVFETQGILLNFENAIPFARFVMAWIEELRKHTLIDEAVPPFGWVIDKTGNYTGLAVGGTLYRCDGSTSETLRGDPKIHENYQPRGDLATWQQSAAFVVGNQVELQAALAVAFAAPLMEFTGHNGVMSIWSTRSGTRKTSTFRVGTSVWCNPITGMSSMRDTTNSVQHSLTQTRLMPVYWDEIHLAQKDDIAAMVEMFFNITQGRGRARLDQRIEQRDPGFWHSLMIISSNRPMLEVIEQDRKGTDAGNLRMFEYEIKLPSQPQASPVATQMMSNITHNYGTAGRVYAQWLAQNIDKARSLIRNLETKLIANIKSSPDERFHLATIQGLLGGAIIAKKLGLVPFDTDRMYKFLVNHLLSLRSKRKPMDDKSLLTEAFDQFIADNVDNLLVTQAFVIRGRKSVLSNDRARVIKSPGHNCTHALIHIGLDDRELRFDQRAFVKWCETHKLSPMVYLNILEQLWSVTRVRAILAISTDWSSGGKVLYYRVQLSSPELQHHLEWGTPNTGTNVIKLPGTP